MTTVLGTMDYDGATDGLLTKVGKMNVAARGVLDDFASWVADVRTAAGKFSTTQVPWFGEVLYDLEDPARQRSDTYLALASAVLQGLRHVAHRTLIEEMHVFDPLMTPRTVGTAIERLRVAMQDNSEDVLKSTVTASVASVGSPTGTGTVAAGVIHPLNGLTAPLCRAEHIELECVEDATFPGITAGRERFRVRGEVSLPALDRSYPGGSGADCTVLSSPASVQDGDEPNENMVRNGDLESWSGGGPVNWRIDTGSAGTNIVVETGSPMRGTSALKMIGDGATLLKISQDFDVATTVGTPAKFRPRHAYRVGLWLRQGTAGLSGGVLRISIQTSGGTVKWTSNASFTLSLLSATYATLQATFVTDASLPAGMKLVVELTTAIPNTENIYIDEIVCEELRPVSPSGPWISVLSGGTNWAAGDRYRITVANTLSQAFKAMDLLYGMYDLGLTLPHVAAAPTNAEALFT